MMKESELPISYLGLKKIKEDQESNYSTFDIKLFFTVGFERKFSSQD